MAVERLVANGEGLQRAAHLIAAGEIVAFPTDTVYGIGCRWDDDAAVDRLFLLKRRPRERRVPILVRSPEDLDDLGLIVDDRARMLMDAFWPGALTIVLAPTTAGAETIGVRAPDHPAALALLRLTGPLRTTSANITGQPEALSAHDVQIAFATSDLLAAVIDGGDVPGGTASTVVDLTSDPPRVVREGPISVAQLRARIGRVVPPG